MNKQLLILLSVCVLTACRNAEQQSTIDNKPLDVEQHNDLTVKPGDNFFMHCNGGWWAKKDLAGKEVDGLLFEASVAAQKRIDQLQSETISKFYNEVTRIDKTQANSIELIKQNLKLVENITTIDEAHDAIVKMVVLGYDNLFAFQPLFKDRSGVAVVSFSDNFILDPVWASDCLTEFGFTNVQERMSWAQGIYFDLLKDQKPLNLSPQHIGKHPEVLESIVSIAQTKAEGSGSLLLDKLIKEMGLNSHQVSIDAKMKSFFSILDKADPQSLKYLLEAFIVQQYAYTSTNAYNKYLQLAQKPISFDDAISKITESKLAYIYAEAYVKQYLSPEVKEKMKGYCEEIRSAFRVRLSHIDWMSETTKEKAREKLDAMTFNVGYPDTWIKSALPTLKGQSLLEDLLTLNQADNNLTKDIMGKPAHEMSFNVALSKMKIETVNAFYEYDVNSINILPIWMMPPFYDESKSDAYNYASFVVVAHEVTHGFDNDGAKFNKDGKLENWWTVSDVMEFNSRQKKIIDSYSLLEIMPVELPGVHVDGVKTLAENIADLGGLQVAFLAYTTKLIAEGYKDEELKKQQRKFFQSYANLWRLKYTSGYAMKMLSEDEHSLAKERVNGTVINMDQWYDLYDVKWGDKLYLKPEFRVSIW